MCCYNRRPARSAFTLFDILVVLAIISILTALLLPAVQKAREATRRIKCGNHLKQIGLAVHNYHDSQKVIPFLLTHNSRVSSSTGFTQGWWSWRVRILPYIEQQPLYNSVDISHDAIEPFMASITKAQVSTNIPVYICPSDPFGEQIWSADWGGPEPVAAAHSNYLGCRGSKHDLPGDGVFPATNKNIRFSGILDGLSNTLLIGERPLDSVGEWGWWALGTGFDFHGFADHVLYNSEGLRIGVPGSSDDLSHFWSMHPGGANFVFCDGSVKFISYSIDHNTFQSLGSRAGSEAAVEL